MTDDELVEKAAQAMANSPHNVDGWEAHTEAERDWYREDASAVLAVFREHSKSLRVGESTAPTGDERELRRVISDALRDAYTWSESTQAVFEAVSAWLRDRPEFEHTAPTGDEREALAQVVKKRLGQYNVADFMKGSMHISEGIADAILAQFRLVPRGESDEAEVLTDILDSVSVVREPGDLRGRSRRQADAILSVFRLVPCGTEGDAVTEAFDRWPRVQDQEKSALYAWATAKRSGFVEGAEWQASRGTPDEPAVTDEMVGRALLGYFPEVEGQPELQDWGANTRKRMRAALMAALSTEKLNTYKNGSSR